MWRVAPQFQIIARGDGLQQRDPLLVIGRYRTDKGDVDILRRRCGQDIENGRLESQMADLGADAGAPETISTIADSCEIIRS